MKPKEMIGLTFGRYKVLSFNGRIGGMLYWLCECQCGKIKSVRGTSLRAGVIKSCGCHNRQITKEINSTHGLSKSRFHNIWISIPQRCYNENNKYYKNYGGRGIRCLRDTFEEFRNDMYESYLKHVEIFGEKETTIDRIDNDGNYCKENCRWTNSIIQNNNKRNNVIIKHMGKSMSIGEWAHELGINYDTLWGRFLKGRRAEKALTNKKYGRMKMLTLNGKSQRITEWAKDLGCSYQCLQKRLDKGLSIEEVLSHSTKKDRGKIDQ